MSIQEKGGGTLEGVKLLLCENPLPPIDEAIAAAEAELPRSNFFHRAILRTTPAADQPSIPIQK